MANNKTSATLGMHIQLIRGLQKPLHEKERKEVRRAVRLLKNISDDAQCDEDIRWLWDHLACICCEYLQDMEIITRDRFIRACENRFQIPGGIELACSLESIRYEINDNELNMRIIWLIRNSGLIVQLYEYLYVSYIGGTIEEQNLNLYLERSVAYLKGLPLCDHYALYIFNYALDAISELYGTVGMDDKEIPSEEMLYIKDYGRNVIEWIKKKK